MKFRVKSVITSRLFRRAVGIPVAIALVLYTASYFLDEPLRRSIEKNINRDLKGYSVQLPKLHVQLLDLSLTFKEMSVLQQAHPEQPVAYFPLLKASIDWREILSGKLVAEFRLDRPRININLLQLRAEAASKGSFKERGWQQAVQYIYPLKINILKVTNANITYIDKDENKPLVLSRLNLLASNIRNINLPEQPYPSSFNLDTAIFDTGHCTIDGNANFLANPYPGIKGRLMLSKVPLDALEPLAAGTNITLHGGLLGASGYAEYSPTVKIAHLENLTISGLKIVYTHSQRTAEIERKRAALVGKTARKLHNRPGLILRADRIGLTECTLGMVNEAVKKPYRIFIADTDLQLSNYSNQNSEEPVQAHLQGKFMGSGMTTASLNFRPENRGSNLDLHLKIDDTRLTAMNGLLRAYGNFDVSGGIFSLVSELHIRNDNISGYIKPFFKDIQVYDRQKDKDQGAFHELYEMMIGGVAGLLENRSRQEVATKANITGSLKNPHASRWEIIGGLIKNAFFKALLPSFDREKPVTDKR